MKNILILIIAQLSLFACRHSILDHGAVPNNSSTEIAFINAKAVTSAVLAANSSDTDREVHIPTGQGNPIFFMMPITFANLYNVTFIIDAVVALSEDNENWPLGPDGKDVIDFFYICDSEYIYIRGSGKIDG